MTSIQKTIASIKIGKRQMMEIAEGKVVKAIILTVIGIILAIPVLIFSKKIREEMIKAAQEMHREIEGA